MYEDRIIAEQASGVKRAQVTPTAEAWIALSSSPGTGHRAPYSDSVQSTSLRTVLVNRNTPVCGSMVN